MKNTLKRILRNYFELLILERADIVGSTMEVHLGRSIGSAIEDHLKMLVVGSMMEVHLRIFIGSAIEVHLEMFIVKSTTDARLKMSLDISRFKILRQGYCP